jgi:hypothetical protein
VHFVGEASTPALKRFKRRWLRLPA